MSFPTIAYVSLSEYSMLIPDVSGIAGCPRSGMRAAAEIAMRIDVPLYEASVEFGLRRCSGGSRLYNQDLHGFRQSTDGPIVIVEDSTCSGASVQALREHRQLKHLPIFAVYAGNHGRTLVDGFAVSIDMPHWFEWNFFNNGQILRDYRVGIDWDGVLNDDCLPEEDDDGERILELDRVRSAHKVSQGISGPSYNYGKARRIPTAVRGLVATLWNQIWTTSHVPWHLCGTLPNGHRKVESRMCERYGVGLFVESSVQQARRIAELRRRNRTMH